MSALLDAQPVVVVMGARQTGKSTLVRHSTALRRHAYLSLDTLEVRRQALSDPEGLVLREPVVIFDEVQRAPDLLISIKAAIDLGPRVPGRFVLTGSANLLSMRAVKETLAGRASYLVLWPFTRREQLGLGTAGCWSELTSASVTTWPELLSAQSAPPEDWRQLCRRSHYPATSLARHTPEQQADWMQGYLETYLARDVAELSQLSRPLDLLRLMRAASTQIGQVENQSGWTRASGLPRTTVSRWLDLLEISYQLIRIPAYSESRTKRLTRSAKIYWSDTAMSLHLTGQTEPTGHHLENMILGDLTAWCSARSQPPRVHHWRTRDQSEVDFVLEMPSGKVLPIEVKAATRPTMDDLKGLREFLLEYPDLALGGLVLHGGTDTYRLSGNIVATPWWRVI